MGEGLPDLVPSGDDDAVGIENAKARERHLLRLDDQRHQRGADRDKSGIGGRFRWRPFRPAAEELMAGEIERRADRRELVRGVGPCLRRNLGAERDATGAVRFNFARENRRKHLALRDQLGLGLADELIVVEAEEEQAAQRQHHHKGQHREHDQPERGPQFLSCGLADHASFSQRPSLKPTP